MSRICTERPVEHLRSRHGLESLLEAAFTVSRQHPFWLIDLLAWWRAVIARMILLPFDAGRKLLRPSCVACRFLASSTARSFFIQKALLFFIHALALSVLCYDPF